jgi:hypothetical protein
MTLLALVRTPVLILMVFMLPACATVQNTLAQDLAWERWKKCDHFANIRLKEIRPDGQIWVFYSDVPSDVPAWQECLRKAAEEQAKKRGVAVAAPPPAATAPPVETATGSSVTKPAVHFPAWKVGDEWAFRWESPRGAGTFAWTVDRTEVVEGTSYYVVKSGTRREIYWRGADLAYYMDKVDGETEVRWTRITGTPIPWPLTEGKTWEFSVTREMPKERRTEERVYKCGVEREESLTVPAGTFAALPVRCVEQRSGRLQEVWWAPAVNQWVRERTQFSYGVRERELIEFRLR